MAITEGSQAQRYVERTFGYRISGTGALLKINLPVRWQPNDDFTGRTVCICATLFIYDKMSVTVSTFLRFPKQSITKITYMTSYFFFFFTVLAP